MFLMIAAAYLDSLLRTQAVAFANQQKKIADGNPALSIGSRLRPPIFLFKPCLSLT
jgi:hypothetical protein